MINDSYGPLISALPLSIADKTYKSESLSETDNSRRSDEKRRDTIDSAIGAPGPSQSVVRTHTTDSLPDSKSNAFFDDLHFSQHPDGAVDYGFAHPALARPQRIVWFPEDTLGLAKEEVTANEASGVLATTAGASMDEVGHVEVHAPPVDLNKF